MHLDHETKAFMRRVLAILAALNCWLSTASLQYLFILSRFAHKLSNFFHAISDLLPSIVTVDLDPVTFFCASLSKRSYLVHHNFKASRHHLHSRDSMAGAGWTFTYINRSSAEYFTSQEDWHPTSKLVPWALVTSCNRSYAVVSNIHFRHLLYSNLWRTCFKPLAFYMNPCTWRAHPFYKRIQLSILTNIAAWKLSSCLKAKTTASTNTMCWEIKNNLLNTDCLQSCTERTQALCGSFKENL